ncbi:hypothetical protein [Paenibacillus ehimensis]|uniref:hypothetical protein n=1 Tax=Paenibacillus ehimensis TaxID=79264 RepID=UPI000472D17A|nr:hypothetical protein [Paenibacillus ehimensis]
MQDGRFVGVEFEKQNLTTDDKFYLWLNGDNEVYLNSSRDTQLQMRKWVLEGYMSNQIENKFPDFNAGLNLDPSLLTVFPNNVVDINKMFGQNGKYIPDEPGHPGRNKMIWELDENTRVTFEKHPYDKGAPEWHRNWHYHVDSTEGSHQRFLLGQNVPEFLKRFFRK